MSYAIDGSIRRDSEISVNISKIGRLWWGGVNAHLFLENKFDESSVQVVSDILVFLFLRDEFVWMITIKDLSN